MNSAWPDHHFPGARRWLAVILLLSLCVNSIGIGWGLPNNQGTWAADSLQPTAPMAIAKHGLFGERWNSGWFYFKYPFGHPLVLLAAQLPYLAWLRINGDFRTPLSTYPYGFRHPDRALTALAVLTRVVSVVMGVGLTALAYVIAAALFGTAAGLGAAVLVTGCYPMVFYAHTSNVDVPMLFWIARSVAATLMAAVPGSRSAAALAGVAMAMALLTKEQSVGALAAIPVVWWLRRSERRAGLWAAAWRQALIASAACAAVVIVVGNVWWNPSGFLNRWRFLLGTLPQPVREKYAPYQFIVQVPKAFSLAREMQHLAKVASTVVSALTIPVLLICMLGTIWALWRRPRYAAVPMVLIASYDVLSLRAGALVPVRYTMPVLYFALILGGALAAAAVDWIGSARRSTARIAAAVLGVAGLCALLPGIEVDRLLVKDPRYAAEAWLRTHLSNPARIETYQRLTYLPRFGDGVQVVQVPIEQRTTGAFAERQPDAVVLSSGGRAGLTGRYERNWQPGMPIIADVQPAQDFFEQLTGERLGYRRVGHFHATTTWITPRINSLNPEITIFARDHISDAP
jgi:hypothetical protein